MKIGEVWKMKPKQLEDLRQIFILDGDDSDFNYEQDYRVIIIDLKNDEVDYRDYDDASCSNHGIPVSEFLEEFEKVYNENR